MFCERKVGTNNSRTLLLGNKSRKRDGDGKKGVQRTVALAVGWPCTLRLSRSIKRQLISAPVTSKQAIRNSVLHGATVHYRIARVRARGFRLACPFNCIKLYVNNVGVTVCLELEKRRTIDIPRQSIIIDSF